ncbi:hypothetical protein BHE74_00038162 [Ensete ventricosum]|nr:hypothetical protein BHE74_00038162 [Ensete ventricosum]
MRSCEGEPLREHRGVEAGGRKGQGSDDESKGTWLPKRKASVRKEVDSEKCHSTAEADLLSTKKGTQMQDGRAEAKELHKTGIDRLLIKIAEMRDFGLMQECSTKERSRQYAILYLFYSEE